MQLSTSMRTIRIGDLRQDVTESDVRGLLAAFGPTHAYTRPADLITKRPGDFALITMNDPGATRAVAALHGRVFRDRLLVVSAYVPDAARRTPV